MTEPLERLSPSQLFLFDRVRRTSRARAETAVAALTNEERIALAEARLQIERARIVVNLNLHERVFYGDQLIDSLIESKRVFNLFEIAHAAQEVNPSDLRVRIMLEFKMYGGTRDLQSVLGGMSNTEHPNYGLLDYLYRPVGYSLVGFYGWYRFVLKDDVKKRSTFSPADSMHITSDQTFLWDDIDGVLASRVSEHGRYWFEYVNERRIPIDEQGNVSYVESQMLGGVFLNETGEHDVDELYYPETDRFNRPFFEKLKQFENEYNIPLKPY